MDIMDQLNELTYRVEHNPNCPLPFLVRLVGKNGGRIDGGPIKKTKDILGYGGTLVDAAWNALRCKTEFGS